VSIIGVEIFWRQMREAAERRAVEAELHAEGLHALLFRAGERGELALEQQAALAAAVDFAHRAYRAAAAEAAALLGVSK
jgi:hypothetical protein